MLAAIRVPWDPEAAHHPGPHHSCRSHTRSTNCLTYYASGPAFKADGLSKHEEIWHRSTLSVRDDLASCFQQVARLEIVAGACSISSIAPCIWYTHLKRYTNTKQNTSRPVPLLCLDCVIGRSQHDTLPVPMWLRPFGRNYPLLTSWPKILYSNSSVRDCTPLPRKNTSGCRQGSYPTL